MREQFTIKSLRASTLAIIDQANAIISDGRLIGANDWKKIIKRYE